MASGLALMKGRFLTRTGSPRREAQIVSILKEREAGVATKDLCRNYGASPATFYVWKDKFGAVSLWNVGQGAAQIQDLCSDSATSTTFGLMDLRLVD